MAATTLVAAPFTFGNNQNVGAASLDEMELLAQYSFESGYTDSVSGKSGTSSESGVSLNKDDSGNTYLSVADEAATGTNKNYVQFANPLLDQEITNGFTIAMKVRNHEDVVVNSWEGLWGFMGEGDVSANTAPCYGLTNYGGFHVGNSGANFFDYTENKGAQNLGISSTQMDELVTVISPDGSIRIYLNGILKTTIDSSSTFENGSAAGLMTGLELLPTMKYFYLGVSSPFDGWRTAGADYDDVRIYSGAADAGAVAAIYKEVTPEALASYTFDDASSIEGLTSVGASVVTDDVQGSVLKIEKNTTSNNYVQLNNPLYQKEASDFTIAMNVLLEEDTDAYRGLWSFSNEAGNVGYFGMSRNGGLRYNGYLPAGEANHWYNTAGYGLGEDTSWHKLAVVVSAEDGTAQIYLDGTLTGTMDASSTFDSYGDAGVDIATLLADVPEYVTKQQYFFLGFASGSNWMTNGASYDNIAIYGRALTALEIANLPGTAQIPGDEEEPVEPMDPTQPYLLTKDEGKWQVIDGQSINTTTKSLTGYITGNNFSISGWMNFNSVSGDHMFLFQMQAAANTANGVRCSVANSGELEVWLKNDKGIDTSWKSKQKLPVGETFLFTLNYDGGNHTITVYINNEVYFTYTNETNVIPATDYSMANIILGGSEWADPKLDGRMADLYISNNLISTDDIAAQVAAADYPDWDDTSDAIIPLIAERENLNIVEVGTKADGTPTTITYDDSDKDNAGRSKITEVNGQAKAQLSTEKYEAETLSTNDVTENAGYREFDTSAFLENADDFTVTAWVHWYGDTASSFGGKSGLKTQRFFDLFNIPTEEQGEYEFYFNGWEQDNEQYIIRNPSVSSESELVAGATEQATMGTGSNQSWEEGVYLCGITAGAVLNGMSRPCFRPGLTWATSRGANSNLPYPNQWNHIAVVYDANGHVGSDGTVYGASLTYYLDGAAYATRYYDYADFDSEADQWIEAYGDAAGLTDALPDSSSSNLVGGSADGADIIYNINADALKVKNMALDTLYLGKSTDSEDFWNGEYRNAYLYNYALTSGEVSEDYVDLVKPLEGASMETPTEANNITTDGNIYALVSESTNASKTMELGFNAEWLNTSAYRGTSSLSFNGDGGYAEVDTSLLTTDGQPIKEDGSNVSDQFTFSTWVNLNDVLDWGRIFDIKGDNGELFLSNNGYFNNDANVGLGLRSSTLENGIETGHNDVSVGTSITAGNWVNITVVIDDTDVSLYFQGELEATGKLTMPLSEMGINTFYLSRSAAVDGKYGLPLDPDNDIILDETYLVQDALSDAQVLQLAQYGYAGAKTSTTQENSTRLEMLDVADLFDADRNVDTYYVDITDHKILSAEVMNALANSTGKTLYVRVEQGVSYDFIWELTSEAFAGRTYSASDEFDLLVSGANMSSADATIILNAYMEQLRVTDPSASVHLQAQTITVYADKLPVELPLFINYNRDFLQTVDNGDGTQTLKDVPLNLYKGTASSYSLVQKGLKAATDQDGNTLMQNYTNPTTNANGTVVQYYVQNLTEGGSFILTPQTLP